LATWKKSQVNHLAVLRLSNERFSIPKRITEKIPSKTHSFPIFFWFRKSVLLSWQ
jgi:hypothetical protein